MHYLTGTTTFQGPYSHKSPVVTVLNGVDMGHSQLSFAGRSVRQCCSDVWSWVGTGWPGDVPPRCASCRRAAFESGRPFLLLR